MKKFFVAMVMFLAMAVYVQAQSLPDDILDLPLAEIGTGTEWHFCSAVATTYTEAKTTYTLGNIALTTPTVGTDGCATGSEEYDLASFDGTPPDTGRALQLCANATAGTVDITLTANGTATHICVVDVANTDFLGCTEINGGTGRAITAFGTETATYDGNAKFQMRDIQ